MKKLPYSEGSVFLVPLEGGGYARGVVARADRRGAVLGYFFGPRLQSTDAVPLDDLRPAGAVLVLRFGDLGLLKGEWPVFGTIASWDRSAWPMPDFVRRESLRDIAWRVRYSEKDLCRVEIEERTELNSTLPPDGLSGSGAVEIKLSRLVP